MAVSNRTKNQHLLWRAGFGPMAENAAQLGEITQQQLWQQLLKASDKGPAKINVAQNLFDGLFKGIQDVAKMEKPELTAEQRRKIREQSRDDLKNLNIYWLEEMINSEAQLREKMALFWHGHFACRVINSYFQQELLHTIRENALGNFKDLLYAVSKSASILSFLNNQQNKKKQPNENFAREVMELFTMGRGNYTETDIKEAARAFTGWGFNLKGEFEFRRAVHDDDSKTVLGKIGNFNGDDVLNILLEQKQTAVYITKKIYRFFVNENVDDGRVKNLAELFFTSGYDIKKLMTAIFTSTWFYDEKNIGTQIKSPIQLLAGIRRYLPMEMDNDQSQLVVQKTLGQILFYPPNVAGWPGGKTWIDSSSLMLRLRLPQIIAANDVFDMRPKSDDDVQMGQMTEAAGKRIKAIGKNGSAAIEWASVTKIFEATPRENILQFVIDTLLQTKARVNNTVLQKYSNNSGRENYIKSVVVSVMSTPEYQLC
jgi:uncharacterized protein (DUF1800 family)